MLASPSDVAEERQVVRQVVDELNLQSHPYRLELLTWEENAYADVGSDGQDVINRAIGNDYDVLIGIFWTRIGAPTPRAVSGTVEECRRALGRNKATPGSVSVMLYFKEAPIEPNRVDPEQLKGVQVYRKEAEASGCLHYGFVDRDQLAKFLRLHIPRVVNGRLTSLTAPPGGEASQVAAAGSSDEEGLFNLAEHIEDGVAQAMEIMTRVAGDTNVLGDSVNARSAELLTLAQAVGPKDFRAARRITDRVASDFETFAGRLETELPHLSLAYDNVFDSMAKALSLTVRYDPTSLSQLASLQTEAGTLIGVVDQVQGQIGAFRDAISATPPMTTALNRAKRRAVGALESFLSELGKVRSMSQEIAKLAADMGATKGTEGTGQASSPNSG